MVKLRDSRVPTQAHQGEDMRKHSNDRHRQRVGGASIARALWAGLYFWRAFKCRSGVACAAGRCCHLIGWTAYRILAPAGKLSPKGHCLRILVIF